MRADAAVAGGRGTADPHVAWRREVPDEWLDYNGHLHDAHYLLALAEANEVLLDVLDLGEAYRARTGHAMYTVEHRLRYRAEVAGGDVLTAAPRLVEVTAKRLSVATALRRGDGRTALEAESVYLHVDAAAGSVVPLPDERYDAAARLLAAQARS